MKLLHFKAWMEFGNLTESNLLTSHDCQNTHGCGAVCVVLCQHIINVGQHSHTHFISLNCSPLLSHRVYTCANICRCANTHAHTQHAQSHQIQSCWQLSLDWYSPATMTGQTSLSSIYSYMFPYLWPEALDTVGSHIIGWGWCAYYCSTRSGKATQYPTGK